jgi:hypothetical protein
MEERDASPNAPKTAANPGKVPKLSSFAEEARTTETEERERDASPNEPDKAANPSKVPKVSSFVEEAWTTETNAKQPKRRRIQPKQTRNMPCHAMTDFLF